MLLSITRGPQVLFVGGKGGVGKTSTSSALALAHAQAGDHVLLISTDPAHNLGHLWGMRLDDTAQRLHTAERGYVDGIEIDPRRTIDQHLQAVAELMTKLLPERMHQHARQHLELAREAPGSHESAVLERIADLVALGTETYDRVIFDTAPTGHTLRLLQLPHQLTTWTETLLRNRDRSERFGAAMRGLTSAADADPERGADAELRQTLTRRRSRFNALQDVLQDPARSGFVIVLTPERIPVSESLELVTSLRSTGMRVLTFVVNRRSPVDSGELLARRHATETDLIEELRSAHSDIPITEVPLLAEEPLGVEGLQHLVANYMP